MWGRMAGPPLPLGVAGRLLVSPLTAAIARPLDSLWRLRVLASTELGAKAVLGEDHELGGRARVLPAAHLGYKGGLVSFND